jgi:drug/metabolite transporter (DMT)-like permease
VPLSALLLTLAAALMHASWNVLLAGSRDSEAASAVATLAGVALLWPLALITWGFESAALPFAAVSTVLHVAYLAMLARAYRSGEVSVVYPVSRGVAPVLVLAAGAAVLGQGASAVQVAGVLAVSAGVFAVSGGSARYRQRDLFLGLAIAVTIAAYTLTDAEGVENSRAPAYLAVMLTPAGLIYTAGLWAGGRAEALRDELRPRALLIGALIVGAYGAVLAALRLADAAPVAAVRESSVVIAALLAAAFLGEQVGVRRLGGAVLVAAGVAAVALG